VILISAMRQGSTPRRVHELARLFGLDRATVARWQAFWRDGRRSPAEDASPPLLVSGVHCLRRRSYAVEGYEKSLETSRLGRPGARGTDPAAAARTEAFDRAQRPAAWTQSSLGKSYAVLHRVSGNGTLVHCTARSSGFCPGLHERPSEVTASDSQKVLRCRRTDARKVRFLTVRLIEGGVLGRAGRKLASSLRPGTPWLPRSRVWPGDSSSLRHHEPGPDSPEDGRARRRPTA
jgi:hypothetical protein